MRIAYRVNKARIRSLRICNIYSFQLLQYWGEQTQMIC